jgi:serine/threonine-protein kinase
MVRYGRYEVVEPLGKGTTGTVYLARDTTLERMVALKVVPTTPDRRRDEVIKRFAREAQAAGRLNHPNIVTVYDVGSRSDCLYLAMERLEGEDLKTLIARRAPMPLSDRARWMCDVCDALGCAHDRGVVHRDVKSANIFITKDGRAKLLDFGFARLAESGTITGRGEVLGTPEYMAPEQASGAPADRRSDIFSAGVVFYEMLSFSRPFSGSTVAAVLFNVLQREPEPLLTLCPDAPARLARVVHRMLAKPPAERPASLLDVRREIAAIPGLLARRSAPRR